MTYEEAKVAKNNNYEVEMFGLHYQIVELKNNKVTVIEVTDNALFAVPISVSPSSLKRII